MRRYQDVSGTGGGPRPGYPSPAGRGGPGNGPWPPASGAHASGARDYTPLNPAMLAERGRRGREYVADVNRQRDPRLAMDAAFDGLRSALRKAGRRNKPAADAWRWAVVHILDALAVCIERGTEPGPWFRDRQHWWLNPEGWVPLKSVTEIYRRLKASPGQENPL